MKSVVLILLAAVLSCGFVLPETPAERTAREKLERTWRNSVTEHFDLGALRDFLDRQIHAVAVVDGVDVQKSKIEAEWKFSDYGCGLHCGNWEFWTDDFKSGAFRLSWMYEEKKRDDGTTLEKSVMFICRRVSRSAFVLVRAERHEDENVILIP